MISSIRNMIHKIWILILLLFALILPIASDATQHEAARFTIRPIQYDSKRATIVLDIAIVDGWKLYAHTISESGLPLEILLENSKNIKSYEIAWPKATEVLIYDTPAIVYSGNISIPIHITAFKELEDISAVVHIKGAACGQYCSSISEHLKLNLPPDVHKDNHINIDKIGDILWVVLSAFIGGVLLNFMPCVLPVLSLKILNIAKCAELGEKGIRSSLAATILGIFTSFAILSLLTSILQAMGQSVGWGLHFQEPAFIMCFILILMLFASNLWGEFDIQLPSKLRNRLNALTVDYGSFLSGALITLLATPCTAPFLSVAVAFALSRGNLELILVYSAIALGVSLPFIILFINTRWARVMPKPGAWMLKLKKVCAVILIMTAIWLVYILSSQICTIALVIFITLTLLLRYLLILHSIHSSNIMLKSITIVVICCSLVYLISERSVPIYREKPYDSFSIQKLNTLLDEGEIVLVDVTAKWCLTCKLNEAMVFDDLEVIDFLQMHNVKLLKADYTNSSPEITQYLKSHGQHGVPSNIMHSKALPHAIVLPTIIDKKTLYEKIGEVSSIQRKETPNLSPSPTPSSLNS